MICPYCGKKNKDGEVLCKKCHHPLNKTSVKAVNVKVKAADKSSKSVGETEADEEFKKREVHVNAGIYKLLCIAMGLCLIAGSVVWASLLLRDRIDSGIKPVADKNTAQASGDEQSENGGTKDGSADNEAASKTASTGESTTTTTTAATTTTTTTTTTADPYKQPVSPQFEDDYGTLYVVTESLAVRIGPGYDYEKTDVMLEMGTALSILAEQADVKSDETWCYISNDEAEGWVNKSSLSEKNPTVTVVLPDEYYTGEDRVWFKVVRYGGLKMYSGPGEEYDVIAEIDEGEELQKEGYNYFSHKWIYTCYNGQYGWIVSYDGNWLNPTIEEI